MEHLSTILFIAVILFVVVFVLGFVFKAVFALIPFILIAAIGYGVWRLMKYGSS